MKKVRKGQVIDSNLCETACNQLDHEKDYDTWEVIEHFRTRREVTLKHVIGWIMGGADWVGEEETEAYVTAKVNEFIQENPPVGEDKELTSITSCVNPDDRARMYAAYERGVSFKKREEYKQALYDKFDNR